MKVGAHVEALDPLGEAARLQADSVQLFLSDPQGWKKPPPREDSAALRKSPIDIYVHSPYLINVGSPNNRIRVPSRKILHNTCEAAVAVGAKAVIVHAGHAEDDVAEGFARWGRTFDQLESEVPIYIENTAGGNNALGRKFDVLAQLWEVVGPKGAGFCFDTCHAHAAGEDLSDSVERVLKIVGRIDLVHCNDSKDAHGSGRDRHENLGSGRVGSDVLRDMLRACSSDVICETPGARMAADLAFVRTVLAG